ncbi:MAG: glutathione S-transferase [Alphaproteobacteria bacterium]|nr:glutathione S-transferase [Alphaproteobacteria bacterium]
MKIIETNMAPNPRRVRIFLAEKGIEIPFEQTELNVENTSSAEFRAKNPMGQVPILVLDDGECISESMAICRYFEALQPQPRLMGDGAVQIARIEMWNRRVELAAFFSIAQAFRHLHPKMVKREVPQVAAWGEANKGKALAAMEMMDRQLLKSEYIAGDTFSVADITLLVAVDFMGAARLDRSKELVGLGRWYESVSARPSAAA